MSVKYKVVCEDCGGENLSLTGSVQWNKDRQDWDVDVGAWDKEAYCGDCQDVRGYEWIEIKEDNS